MNRESLFLLLLLAFAMFWTLVLPWLRQRLESRMPPESESEALQPARRAYAARGRPSSREDTMRAPPPAPAPPAAARRKARWPVTSLRDARRGIVLMALLGPCRALEPYDPASKRSL